MEKTNPPEIPSETRYRLRGLVDGTERTFDLTLGDHRIGSSKESDIHFALRGVSRQHAVVTVTPEGLAVEDRGSKNGTFVEHRAVRRASVAAGALVRFGPVAFEVQAVEAADVELAVVMEDSSRVSTRVSETPGALTTELVDTSVSPTESWLRLVEGFAERLLGEGAADRGGALAGLNRALGTAGSCLLEWQDDPLVLEARGRLGKFPPLGRRRAAPAAGAMSFESSTGRTAAFLGRHRKPALGLVVWGDFPGRSGSEVLFRILLRMVDRRGRRHVPGGAPARAPARRSVPELDFPEDYLPGVSPAMNALYEQLRAAVQRDDPVLLLGETGVGKERLAAALHRSSARRDGPLIAINCAAIPADLLESELFGIGKGVATGVDRRAGKFQLAEGGTVFLDEIGEMVPALQAKLLRVLQEKEVQPVGGLPRPIDVRIVAATNADLEERMSRGEFRRDLYYRLAGHVLEVPPLRRCREDIPILVDHFLRTFAREADVRLRGMTVKALEVLIAYPWPGNVRELQHEIRRLVQRCAGGVIDSTKLPARLVSAASPPAERSSPEEDESLRLEPHWRDLERRLIREALRRSRSRQVHAAKLLGISRNGLADKIKRLGIDVRQFRH